MDLEARLPQPDGSLFAEVHAGARLALYESKPKDHLRLYDKQEAKLVEKLPGPDRILGDYLDDGSSASWNTSFNTILAINKHAANLLILWSFLDHNDLWYGLFQKASRYKTIVEALHRDLGDIVKDEASFANTMHMLRSHLLVGGPNRSRGYTMHASAHSWVYLHHGVKHELDLGRLAVNIVGCAVSTLNEWHDVRTEQCLLAHADVCSAKVVYRDGLSLRNERYFSNSFGLQIDWVARTDYLFSMINLGQLYANLLRFAEAEKMFLHALDDYEGVSRPMSGHVFILKVANNLGNLYRIQGKFDEAEPMLLRALVGYETALGTEHPATLVTVNNLGILYSAQNEFTKAEQMLLRASKGYEGLASADLVLVLGASYNLSLLYFKQGELQQDLHKLREAEKLLLRISERYKTSLGTNHDLTLSATRYLDLVRLAQEPLLRRQEQNRMKDIANQVTSVVRGKGALQISFEMCWYGDLLDDATERLHARGFEDEEIVAKDTIDSAFTITGTATNAVMMTCGEYLQEVWFERGAKFIALLKSALCKPKKAQKGRISERTTIQMRLLKERRLVIDASGDELHVMREVAEMLGWLAAALYPCTNGQELEMSLPSVSITESVEETFPPNAELKSFNCHVSVEQKTVSSTAPGQCWHAMFSGVRIVGGYPTPARDSSIFGLELSLTAIAQLLRTDSAITQNGFLSIRKFDHALVPAYHKENTIGWHYIYSSDGERIPYWKAHSHEVEGLKISELHKARHIVGWCSPASSMTGAPGDHYHIERSHLSDPPWKISLEGFTISLSQYVGASVTGKFGVHSPALRIRPKAFVPQLLGLRQEYVVLWNDGEQRGWLTDGLSTLLHLVRASLYAKSIDPLSEDVLCLDLSEIEDPDGQYPEAAIRFFVKNKKIHPNMSLEIYPGGYLVQDVVEHIYEVLSSIIDRQYQLAKQDGKQFAPRLGRDLTGWDILEIAMEEGRCEPRSAGFLPSSSAGWFELVRKINAPVLFGRNLGELIRPTESDHLCEYWSTLPKEKYYLASCISTIENIIKKGGGDPSSSAIKLTDRLVWHRSATVSRECKCNNTTQGKHCDLAQNIGPNKLQKKSLEHQPPLPWNDQAAIVFS